MKISVIVFLLLTFITNITAMNNLIDAIRNEDIKLFKYLVMAKGIDPNQRDEQGLTLLMHAIETGNEELIKTVINFTNQNYNNQDSDGFTALIREIRAENQRTVQILLNNNIGPNQTDSQDSTPLMHAIDKGNEEIFNILLNNNARVTRELLEQKEQSLEILRIEHLQKFLDQLKRNQEMQAMFDDFDDFDSEDTAPINNDTQEFIEKLEKIIIAKQRTGQVQRQQLRQQQQLRSKIKNINSQLTQEKSEIGLIGLLAKLGVLEQEAIQRLEEANKAQLIQKLQTDIKVIQDIKKTITNRIQQQRIKKQIIDIKNQLTEELPEIAFQELLEKLQILKQEIQQLLGQEIEQQLLQKLQCDQNLIQRLEETIEQKLQQECCICLEKIDNNNCFRTPCKHLFHINCLEEWLRNKHTCPMCRRGLNEIKPNLANLYCEYENQIIEKQIQQIMEALQKREPQTEVLKKIRKLEEQTQIQQEETLERIQQEGQTPQLEQQLQKYHKTLELLENIKQQI